ncbi:MAG: gephyrin-like molybdotransferase Glp [Bacteroidota bacterium]
MITVEEAKAILIKNVFQLSGTTTIDVNNALGYTLAENIVALLNLPPFNQSNVDGYAVNLADSLTNKWEVVNEIKAGDNTVMELGKGEAARIFTGAIVPAGSDAVIMQEKITRTENTIHYSETTPIKKGEHIRNAGAHIKNGDLALNKGTILNPAALSFLNALGINNVSVFNKPKIALIITGNELQPAGTILENGKIFESNSVALQSALAAMSLSLNKILFVKDDKNSLEAAVTEALADTDILLISGGISVGDYDYVNEVLNENGTNTLFYKIAQKPGKPLYFGKNKNTFVFGLPGNPASALTCFYEYVFPALKKMMGHENVFLKTVQLPVSKEIIKKSGMALFLKAKATDSAIEPLDGQESFIMKSFAMTNAFIYLPLEKETVKAGENVEVHLLPEY